MAVRTLVTLAVVIAAQALAGCGMPGKDGVARDDRSDGRRAELEARDAQLRRQVETGSFGLAQLFPGGTTVDARHLPPLPRPSAIVPVASVAVPVPQSNAPAKPIQLASSAATGDPDACVYKPVMSDADIDACR
jgi:hypothetical protein